MIKMLYPTLGPERFQEIKVKVMKARADRDKAGYHPPLTDENLTRKPIPLVIYRKSVRQLEREKAAKATGALADTLTHNE